MLYFDAISYFFVYEKSIVGASFVGIHRRT